MAATTGTLTDASPDSAVISVTATDPHIEVFDCQKWDQVKLIHSIDGGDPTSDQWAHTFEGSGKVHLKAEVGDKIQFLLNPINADPTRVVTYEIRSS